MAFRAHHRLALGGVALLTAVGLGLVASDPLPGTPGEANAASARGRPNIVLIQLDDQTTAQLTPNVMPKTFRLLSRRGTTFTNYLATTAQCCPSRASLLTGQYAHNHGATSNAAGYPALINKRNVLPTWLRRAGYRTIHVGKFLNGYASWANPPSRVAPGWSEWHTVLKPGARYYNYWYAVNGRLRRRGHQPEAYVGRVIRKDAVRLIRESAPRRPFYLQLDERAPHVAVQDDPYGPCDRAPIPDPRDEDRFRRAAVPWPPSFDEADMSDKPSFLRSAPRVSSAHQRRIRKVRRCAMASLVSVDRTVSRVFKAVKRSGELRKTVFILASDNGLFNGEHRILSGKVFPYEEALRVPLVIRLPKRYRGGAGRVARVRKPVANIDLAPTILRLAQAQPCLADGTCRTMDGRSLMPLLKGKNDWPDGRGLLTEYQVPDAGRYATCEFAGIRTRQNVYIRHLRVVNRSTSQCVPTDQRERYELDQDPFELDNLCFGGDPASCPGNQQQLQLENRLGRLRSCAGVEGRDARVGGRPFCE